MIHLLPYTVDHGRFVSSCQHAGGYPPKSVTVSKMAKQCRLTRVQFLDLVDCPMSREHYEQHLGSQGHL
jgi:hypothetical protein